MTQDQTENQSNVDTASPKRLAVVYRLVVDVKLATTNPRAHPKKQIAQIAESIRVFGFLVPVLVDNEGNVIAGHGRVLAAKHLGLPEIPTICIADLTDSQIKAFRIADNRLSENSQWSKRLLAQELRSLAEVNLDFDIQVTGFSIGQIDCRIVGLSSPLAGEDPGDEIPDVNDRVQVAKPGDLWRLGAHRILCADARLSESFSRLMEHQHAGMVFTDPPYNLVIDGHVSGKGCVKHSEFPMASGEMSQDQYRTFLMCVFKLIAQNTADGGIIFTFIDWRHLGEVLQISKEIFSELKNVCVWGKDRAGMGTFYRSQYELVCVFKNGTATHLNNFELGQHGRYRSNLWSYPCPVSFGGSREEGDLLALHPTVKPVALVADAIMDVSKRKDIVLDPFLGSGTAIIAAERTGRVCYGLELDPQYVDLSIRRWQAFTGKSAQLAASGRSFNELEMEVTDVR